MRIILHIIITLSLVVGASSCHPDRSSRLSEEWAEAKQLLASGKEDKALSLLLDLEAGMTESDSAARRFDVLSQIAGIYYTDYKKEKAHEYFRKALEVAYGCDRERLGMALWNQCLTINNADSLVALLEECREVSRTCGLRYTEAMAGIGLANIFTQSGKRGKAWDTLESLDTVVGKDKVLTMELAHAKIDFLIAEGDFDKALAAMQEVHPDSLSLDGKLSRYRNLYRIEVGRLLYPSALNYRDSMDWVKSQIDSVTYNDGLAKAELAFSSKVEKERTRCNQAVWLGGMVSVFLAFLVLLGMKRRCILRRQLDLTEQIKRLNLKISQLSETHDEESEQEANAEAKKESVEKEVIEKLRLNRELFRNLPAYLLLKQLNLKRDADAIDKAKAKEVLEAVIGQFADVCTNLRQLYPGMTYDDVLYGAMAYVGCSKEVASVALGASEDALRRRKSRIKQKLSQAVFEAVFETKL